MRSVHPLSVPPKLPCYDQYCKVRRSITVERITLIIMELKRLLEGDCPGLLFIETTKFKFASFYASKTASEVAEFWSEPRAFTLPMDGPVGELLCVLCEFMGNMVSLTKYCEQEKLAIVDKQVRELISAPLEKELPAVDVEYVPRCVNF